MARFAPTLNPVEIQEIFKVGRTSGDEQGGELIKVFVVRQDEGAKTAMVPHIDVSFAHFLDVQRVVLRHESQDLGWRLDDARTSDALYTANPLLHLCQIGSGMQFSSKMPFCADGRIQTWLNAEKAKSDSTRSSLSGTKKNNNVEQWTEWEAGMTNQVESLGKTSQEDFIGNYGSFLAHVDENLHLDKQHFDLGRDLWTWACNEGIIAYQPKKHKAQIKRKRA